jgi:hypothetical protein
MAPAGLADSEAGRDGSALSAGERAVSGGSCSGTQRPAPACGKAATGKQSFGGM